MAEAIGVVSGVIGIVAATLHAVRRTSNIFREIADAPKDLERLLQELDGLELILTQLNESNYNESTERRSSAVEICLKTCNDQMNQLQGLIHKFGTVGSGGKRVQRLGQGVKKYLKNDELKNAANTLLSQKMSLCLALLVGFFSDQQLNPRKEGITAKLPEQLDYPLFSQPLNSRRMLQRASTFAPTTRPTSYNLIGPVAMDSTNERGSVNTSLRHAISKEIDESGKMLLEDMRKDPNTKIETVLHLDPQQLQTLWRTDLQSIQELRDAVHSQRRTGKPSNICSRKG
jgi:hypothetical protein